MEALGRPLQRRLGSEPLLREGAPSCSSSAPTYYRGLNDYSRVPLKGSIRATVSDLEGYYNLGTLMIRIGFGGISYYNSNPKTLPAPTKTYFFVGSYYTSYYGGLRYSASL